MIKIKDTPLVNFLSKVVVDEEPESIDYNGDMMDTFELWEQAILNQYSQHIIRNAEAFKTAVPESVLQQSIRQMEQEGKNYGEFDGFGKL